MFVSGLCAVGTVLSLGMFAGEATAYTRGVCAISGVVEAPSTWWRGNCSVQNQAAGWGTQVIKYPIPIDSSANISARAWVIGDNTSTSNVCGSLMTFQNNLMFASTGAPICTSTSAYLQQALTFGPIATPSSNGAATLALTVSNGNSVYTISVTQ